MRALTFDEIDEVSGGQKSSFEFKFKFSTSEKTGKHGETHSKMKVECKLKIKGNPDLSGIDFSLLPFVCAEQ